MSSQPSSHESAPLFGGATVISSKGTPLGIAGLIVRGRTGELFALSHVGIDETGIGPSVDGSSGPVRMGPNVLRSWPSPSMSAFESEGRSICRLIGAYPIPRGAHVSSSVASLGGLGTVLESVMPIRTAGTTLRLINGHSSYSEWRVATIGAEAHFQRSGKFSGIFEDAVECIAIDQPGPRSGLAGAVFFTPSGHPVGMLAGWQDDRALMAPLRPLLWHAELEPINDTDAAEHNGEIEREYQPVVSAERPSDAAILLAVASPGQGASSTTALEPREDATNLDAKASFSRSWTYRFGMFPLRPAPALKELVGVDELREHLDVAHRASGRQAYQDRLRKWLGGALQLRSKAHSVADLQHAFAPLILEEADRPMREVMAALDHVDCHRKIQAVRYAVSRLGGSADRYPARTRTQLWWLIQDYLVRRGSNELQFDLEDDIYRAASIRMAIVVSKLAGAPRDPDLGHELFAMVEAVCALPARPRRNALVRTTAGALAKFATNYSAFLAARLIFQVVREAGDAAADAIAKNPESLSRVRVYEAELAERTANFTSRFDDRLHYILLGMGVCDADIAQIFSSMANQGSRELPGTISLSELHAVIRSDTARVHAEIAGILSR